MKLFRKRTDNVITDIIQISALAGRVYRDGDITLCIDMAPV